MVDNFHIWYIALSCWLEEPYCFWWRSEVMWGHQRSKTKNLVITISHFRNGWQFSYVIYSYVMWRGRTLLFSVEVRGHLRLPKVKLQKPHRWLVITISQDIHDQHYICDIQICHVERKTRRTRPIPPPLLHQKLCPLPDAWGPHSAPDPHEPILKINFSP